MEGSATSEGPLSPDQREELQRANERLQKPILGSAKVAGINAWTLAIFGGLSVLAGLFSLSTLIVGVALLAIAWNEFRGRDLVRRLDPRGPRILAWNQLVLVVAVGIYCTWRSWVAWARPEPSVTELETALDLDPGEVGRLTVMAYGAVFVITAVVLVFTARYHLRRASRLETYLRDTPSWVVDIQRSTTLGG